jgi:CBS domain containing-hemolysin-like protein
VEYGAVGVPALGCLAVRCARAHRRCLPIELALGLVGLGLLILVNALFVAAELSLVAIDRDRVDALAAQGSRPARIVARSLERLSLTLSGTQLGVTVLSLVLGIVAEPTVARVLEPLVAVLPDGVERGVSVLVALVIVTALTMVLGELLPKGIAVADPVRVALWLAAPLRVYSIVLGPLIRLLNRAADWTVRRLGVEPREELRSVRTIDELELLIASSGQEGTLDPQAFTLLTRTIRFGHKTAADALVPRLDMVTIGRNATVAELATLALETGHSRFPVIGDDIDDVIGVVHVKDVLRVPPEDRPRTPVTDLAAPAAFIPEGRDLESLLTEMRAGGVQLAVVADEYGGVAGIVTLEDLLEEIVGDIEDEYDAVPVTSPVPAGATIVEGTLHLDEVEETTGFHVPDGPYETLAGFVLARLGHLPAPGERVRHEGWELEVLEMDRRRIASIRVTPPKDGR